MTAAALLAAPPGDRQGPPLPRLLRALLATLVAIWQTAPTDALRWRAMIAVELVTPLVDLRTPVALPDGDLGELRCHLADLVTVLSWDARRKSWWPGLLDALLALLGDLGAELEGAGKGRAAA